jgi:HAD superfamily hydrolase (TIGR01549 family)
MRREMGFPVGQPILEGIEGLAAGALREQCLEILHAHERRGAESATLICGTRELLAELTRLKLPQAILTRNSRPMTALALRRLELEFSQVLTREDAVPKPDPAGLWKICDVWGLTVDEVVFVGDFHFDLLAGKAAGIRSILFAPDGPPDYADEADFVVEKLVEITAVISALNSRA